MRRYYPSGILLYFFCFSISVVVSAQIISIPRILSPAAVFTQTIGISTIQVSYSRPSVRNREIWGQLVPYGWNKQNFGSGNAAPWRAGANENTVIRFSHQVRIEGKTVPAGSYGLFFTANDDNSGEVILSKDFQNWGSFFYDSLNDQLRSDIRLRNIAQTELLTYDFINITKNGGVLVLNWEKKQFPVRIEFDVDSIVMEHARETLNGPAGLTWKDYSSAAGYALEQNIQLIQALEWINKAISLHNNLETISIKSALLEALGYKADAEKLINTALSSASESEIKNYGYKLLNTGNLKKALDVFLINSTRYSKSAGVWFSLGEAYFKMGDKKNAIACFTKSLTLKPETAVKTGSEQYLLQLEGK